MCGKFEPGTRGGKEPETLQSLFLMPKGAGFPPWGGKKEKNGQKKEKGEVGPKLSCDKEGKGSKPQRWKGREKKNKEGWMTEGKKRPIGGNNAGNKQSLSSR